MSYASSITIPFASNAARIQELEVSLAEAIRARQRVESELKAKDYFLATLAHELRTPLVPVMIIAEQLSNDRRLPEDLREMIEILERNVRLEKCLIDDIQDIASISNGKFSVRKQTCDIHRIIGSTIEIVQAEVTGKEIQMNLDLTAQHSSLIADPIRLQQVLWNLIGNAVKFTEQRGRIVIRTQNEFTQNETGWLRIDVIDSGIGISPEATESVFRPFEQITSSSMQNCKGMGLGLAIARSIVALHNGMIYATSPGHRKGTTFTVKLPMRVPSLGGS